MLFIVLIVISVVLCYSVIAHKAKETKAAQDKGSH